MLKESLMRLARRAWIGARGAVELCVSRKRLDSLLARAGFFEWKSRLLRSELRLPGEIRVLCRPDDARVVQEVLQEEVYACARISEGDTILDAGAHVGSYTLYAVKRKRAGRVIAVEPAPLNRELLLENIRRNGLENVKVYGCALADREGQESLFFPGDHACYSLRPTGKDATVTPVSVRTLDSIFAAERLLNCAVLKIDVEGAELMVLKGAERSLPRVRQLVVEVTKREDLPREIRDFLRSRGYECSVRHEDPGGLLLLARRPPF